MPRATLHGSRITLSSWKPWEVPAMAKGQMKAKKEVRKPKKDAGKKPAAAAAAKPAAGAKK